MTNRLIAMATAIFVSGSLMAQQNSLTSFIKEKKSDNFYTYKDDAPINAKTLISDYKAELGLGENDELRLIRKETDQVGFTHYRYQQFHGGVEVFGAQYLVHEKQGSVRSSNGNLVNAMTAKSYSLNPNQAIQKGINHVNANTYMWEIHEEEQLLKRLTGDLNASYYPTAELMYYNRYFSSNGSHYSMAYKMEIYAKDPVAKYVVFVDAQTGAIMNSFNKLHTAEVTGTANTKYAGTQSIQTDSTGVNSYRLREYARGGGIETYNMQQGTNYGNAVDFTDTDNIWNNVNAQQDEAATDAHWAAEMTYDYFMLQHGRNSYDNAGSTLLSYVHYDANYSNAFWDGQRMTYGDGDGSTYTALTSLDVGGHEIAHGVTEYAANLIYQDEPGALNESFSDIFGTAVEFYADPGNADWFIGEDFDVNGNGFRSMIDPNAEGDPDTYHGVNWEFGPGDNGGVHTNSGVQNYWFYLLSVGGTGVNDNSDPYNVAGIGMDSAAAIAYRNLTVYLTVSSEYVDARLGAIQSAEDLYGPCSNAVIETAKAWAAVGVGFPIEDNDLMVIDIEAPATACGLTNAETVTIKIRNNGCSVDLNPGTNIPVAFQVDAGPVVNETVVLASTLAGGDTLTYTFTATADLSTVGMHNVSAWAKYALDPQDVNDSIVNLNVEHKLQQNIDMAMVEVLSPTSDCHLSNAENVDISIQFLGCDSLPAGTSVDVEYELNGGGVVNETVVLPTTLFPEDTLFYTFTTTADLSANGTHTIDAWTAYSADNMNTNDTLPSMSVKHPYALFDDDTVTFENNTAVLDTTILATNVQSNANVSGASALGNYALRLTGGDPINSGIIPDLDTSNFWSKNMEYAASAKFCVDATGWSAAYMQFDLRQTTSLIYNVQFGQSVPEASSLRVTVNGNQVSGVYNPTTETSDPFVTQSLDISAYAGTQFEVVFESRMGFSEAADPMSILGSEGDNAYIDNILFTQIPVGLDEQVAGLDQVSIFPNPTEGQLAVQFVATETQTIEIKLIDVLGNTVEVFALEATRGFNSYNLDISNHSNGVYLINLLSQGKAINSRIIKH